MNKSIEKNAVSFSLSNTKLIQRVYNSSCMLDGLKDFKSEAEDKFKLKFKAEKTKITIT